MVQLILPFCEKNLILKNKYFKYIEKDISTYLFMIQAALMLSFILFSSKKINRKPKYAF